MRATERLRGSGGRVAFAALLILVAVIAVIAALGFTSPVAQRLPLLVGLPLVALGLADLALELRGPAKPEAARLKGDATEGVSAAAALTPNVPEARETGDLAAEPDTQEGMAQSVALLAVFLFVAVYVVFGQFASIPIGTILLLRMARQSWLSVATTSAVTLVLIYGIATWLNVQTHDGWLDIGALIRRFVDA